MNVPTKMIPKVQLKKMDFVSESLFHKQVENQVHFFHYATVNDILCKHTGVIGKSEKIEVTQDEYAPFIYNQLVEDAKQNNSSASLRHSYTMQYQPKDDFYHWSAFQKDFKKELIWSGIGKVTGGSAQTEVKELWFYSASERLMLNLAIELSEKHALQGVVKVFENNYSMSCFGMGDAGGKLIYKK